MARSNIFRIPKGRKYYTDCERLDYKIAQTTKSIEHLKKVIRAEAQTAPFAVKNKSYKDLKILKYKLDELNKKKILQNSKKLKRNKRPGPKIPIVNPSFLKNRESGNIITTTNKAKESFAKEKFEKSLKNYPKGGKTRRDPFATQKDPTEDFDVNDLYKYR